MTTQNKHLNAHGFTLVELAIVITIIGILIGGVLKGQQLIEQARLAATINQINNYRSALSIFKTTYNELPGDMIDPDARIVGCSGCKATINTQGDGLIGNGDVIMREFNNTSEQTLFWLHLLKADMINGVSDAALTSSGPAIGETHPAAKTGGLFYAETGSGRNGDAYATGVWGDGGPPQTIGLSIGIRNGLTTTYREWETYYVISPQSAAQIDRKLDDGKPLSGDVRGLTRNSNYSGCAINGNNYAEAETSSAHCTIAAVIGE